MSGTMRLLLALALAWLTAWTIAGYYMHEAGVEEVAEATHVETPATSLARGAELRVEGTLADTATTTAPLRGKPCVAAVTTTLAVSHYRDIHDRPTSDSAEIATRRVGPENLEIVVDGGRVLLPLERWIPRDVASEEMASLPPQLGITAEQIAAAKARLRGPFTAFRVAEATIAGGAHVFVVGRLEDRAGPLRLEPDPVLGRVELYVGSREQYLAQLRGSGSGLMLAGWILGAGVGPLPLAAIGLVLLLRRRRVAR